MDQQCRRSDTVTANATVPERFTLLSLVEQRHRAEIELEEAKRRTEIAMEEERRKTRLAVEKERRISLTSVSDALPADALSLESNADWAFSIRRNGVADGPPDELTVPELRDSSRKNDPLRASPKASSSDPAERRN
jgi:hypothetical protein